jgi:L-amino acid N-acyltransferase YncA/protein-tyrosine-phosphatase
MRTGTSYDYLIRDATADDIADIRRIYNEGIADRIATLDADSKDAGDMAAWWTEHAGRYAVLVAETRTRALVGWASLNRYSQRCAHRGIADLSVYVSRDSRGTGAGAALLATLELRAKTNDFHKIVLFALAKNDSALRLYARGGYREVGIFRDHGVLDAEYVDVTSMEKILRPAILFVCRHNTGRSQMAEAYLRSLTGSAVEVSSAGTVAANAPNAGVVAAMAEDGIDISAALPKLLDPLVVARADRIITMGCDVEGVPRRDDDWALPDPKGRSPERVREIRDLVKAKADALSRDLLARIDRARTDAF